MTEGTNPAWGMAAWLIVAASVQAQDPPAVRTADDAWEAEFRVLRGRERQERLRTDPELAAVHRKLDEVRVDANASDVSLYDMLEVLRDAAKANIDIDPEVKSAGTPDRTADFHIEGATFREALEIVLKGAGLTWEVENGLIVVREAEAVRRRDAWNAVLWTGVSTEDAWRRTPRGVAPEDARVLEKLRALTMTFCVVHSIPQGSSADPLEYLREVTGLEIRAHPDVPAKFRERESWWGHFGDLPLDNLLGIIARRNDLRTTVHGGAVVFLHEENLLGDTTQPAVDLPAVLTPLGRNAQGCEEFRHESSGIVLVRLPTGRKGATIPKDFLISRTEVTNAQFRKFADTRIYARGHSSGQWRGKDLDDPDRPVVGVGRTEIQAFCRWGGLRLPSEAEWEFAACGGDGRIFPWGDAWPPPAGAGNYADLAAQVEAGLPLILKDYDDGYAATATVARFSANPFGLHDLGGNAWEVCGAGSALRGGGWNSARPAYLRCSANIAGHDGEPSPMVGFRVAMDAPE